MPDGAATGTRERPLAWTCRTCGDTLDGLVALVSHACDAILTAPDITRQERNTLLYVESCVVDNYGELDEEKMNMEDQQALKLFQAVGILDVGDDLWKDEAIAVMQFTDGAWALAGECRKLRAAQWAGDNQAIDTTVRGPEKPRRNPDAKPLHRVGNVFPADPRHENVWRAIRRLRAWEGAAALALPEAGVEDDR